MSRDPRRFDTPNDFRLDRKNRQTQLAFGRGIHTCVGAALARKGPKLALEHLFDRIADIRIDETIHGPTNARRYDYEPNYTQRALCAVHIQFTDPAARPFSRPTRMRCTAVDHRAQFAALPAVLVS
jgi:hypothetical protein